MNRKKIVLFPLVILLFLSALPFSLLAQLKTVPVAVNQKAQEEDMQKQLSNYLSAGNQIGTAEVCNKLAFLYWDAGSTKEAAEYFNKSLEINKQVGNKNALKHIYGNMGMIYADAELYNEALDFFNQGYKISSSQSNKPDMAETLLNIAQIHQYKNQVSESISKALLALDYAKEVNDISLIRNSYSLLAENYEKAGNSKESLKYYDLYASLQKHLQQQQLAKLEDRTKAAEQEIVTKEKLLKSTEDTLQEVIKDAEQKSLQLQFAENEKELAALKAREQEALYQEENRQKKYILMVATIIIGLITIFLLIISKQYKEKNKAYKLLEDKNKEVELQKQEVEKQRDIASHQKQKITDSIMYAQRIQQAVLPPHEEIAKSFGEFFILFEPRDIVSGDFYWMARKENLVIFAAADCTGHGVPGAFMSMLGIAFLNEIVNKITVNKHIQSLQANEILNQLRAQVIESLHQTDERNLQKDGMDIALCIIDFENNKLQYSGAHNPVYIIRNNELLQYKADRMPVSIHQHADKPFTNHVIDLKNDDCIYLLSDGYVDQLGGPQGMKFLPKRFKELILSIHLMPMEEQKELLKQRIEEWKGTEEQMDDMLIAGFRYIPASSAKHQEDRTNWKNKRILIAEDTDINYFLLVEALRKTEVEIIRANNGKEAIEICKANNIDLVLMDINMPVLNGLDATIKIRAFNSTIPIIAQTAQGFDDAKTDSLKAGCNDYISKPIDLKTFISTLEKHLFL